MAKNYYIVCPNIDCPLYGKDQLIAANLKEGVHDEFEQHLLLSLYNIAGAFIICDYCKTRISAKDWFSLNI
ncbi:MAG TPA: hypothetical protein VJC17_03400 [Candidatus Dojkabacteria bacterium]|nr:hypothetical protein [Candidatus Dojkabacteria bacterium]